MVVNVKVKMILVLVYRGRETRGGGRLSLHLANLSLIPAFAFSVAKFLDDVVEVEIVHANLRAYSSGGSVGYM